MKKQNPAVKTLLATGGWNAGSKPFSDMVETRANRSEFVTSTIDFLRQRDFDGLDMDWEYPGKRGGRPEDRARLVLLLEVSNPLIIIKAFLKGLQIFSNVVWCPGISIAGQLFVSMSSFLIHHGGNHDLFVCP